MNDYGRKYLIERVGRHRDDYRDARSKDYTDHERELDYDDYGDGDDYRKGARGTGRRMRRDYMYDDYGDKGKMYRLTKTEMSKWKHNMENADGTRGEHYDMQEVMHAAERLGIKFDEFTEKQFCLATNIMYSDYGHVLKKYVQPDKELIVCADMARAYFDDPDGLDPDEKLAVHYHCMMNFE